MAIMAPLALAAVLVGLYFVFDRRRYHGKSDRRASMVPTPEVFRDPASGVRMRVYEDPQSGAREYRQEPEETQ